MSDLEKLHSLDDRVNKVLHRLANSTARLVLEIRTHHRHNEKLDVFRSFITQLERTADNLDHLADMHQPQRSPAYEQAMQTAREVLRQRPTLVSTQSVATPGEPGQQG